MQITIFTFAQARTQLGFSEIAVDCQSTETPRQILSRIAPQYDPGKTVRVALDQEYADWDQAVGHATELAVIPPVSGG
jgi:molybdopterin converting factor small subunit